MPLRRSHFRRAIGPLRRACPQRDAHRVEKSPARGSLEFGDGRGEPEVGFSPGTRGRTSSCRTRPFRTRPPGAAHVCENAPVYGPLATLRYQEFSLTPPTCGPRRWTLADEKLVRFARPPLVDRRPEGGFSISFSLISRLSLGLVTSGLIGNDLLMERPVSPSLEEINVVSPIVLKATTQILGWSEEESDFEAFGSGILLRVARCEFLLTALHVLNDLNKEKRFLALPPSVAGKFQCRRSLNRIESCSIEGTDVAVILLNGRYELPKDSSFISLSDISSESLSWKDPLLVSGYPTSPKKTVIRHSVKSVGVKPLLHGSQLHSDPSTIQGFNPALHIPLLYDHDDVLGEKGRGPAVSPKGCSGGGIWRLPRDWKKENFHLPKLVGIVSDWRSERKAIFGTQIRYALACIENLVPDLRVTLKKF